MTSAAGGREAHVDALAVALRSGIRVETQTFWEAEEVHAGDLRDRVLVSLLRGNYWFASAARGCQKLTWHPACMMMSELCGRGIDSVRLGGGGGPA